MSTHVRSSIYDYYLSQTSLNVQGDPGPKGPLVLKGFFLWILGTCVVHSFHTAFNTEASQRI